MRSSPIASKSGYDEDAEQRLVKEHIREWRQEQQEGSDDDERRGCDPFSASSLPAASSAAKPSTTLADMRFRGCGRA
jgi:hypothetical protein